MKKRMKIKKDLEASRNAKVRDGPMGRWPCNGL